jgi:deoxycytidylate deaminase
MPLDEIGMLLAKAVRSLSLEERKRLGAALLRDLRKPVGKLGRNN